MALTFKIKTSELGESKELIKLKKHMQKLEKKNLVGESLPSRHLKKNMWIIKPENENRGRGIELASNYKQLLSFLYERNKVD
jgi:hypothetical protein